MWLAFHPLCCLWGSVLSRTIHQSALTSNPVGDQTSKATTKAMSPSMCEWNASCKACEEFHWAWEEEGSEADKGREAIRIVHVSIMAPYVKAVCNGFEGTMLVGIGRVPLFALITITMFRTLLWCMVINISYQKQGQRLGPKQRITVQLLQEILGHWAFASKIRKLPPVYCASLLFSSQLEVRGLWHFCYCKSGEKLLLAITFFAN